MRSARPIDNKHSIAIEETVLIPVLCKRLADGTLQPIPTDEPTILFRGRDKLALPMLQHYRQLCVADGCTDYQLQSLADMIRKFEEFATTGQMKQPGSTLGK